MPSQETRSPVCFGDVVQITDGSLGIVYLPDRGADHCACFEIDELGELARQDGQLDVLIAGWDAIHRVLGPLATLPDHVTKALEPYRRGLVLGNAHWERGVELLDEPEQILFRSGRWSALPDSTRELVESLFGPLRHLYADQEEWEACYRVLVHLGEDWSSWHAYGALTEAEAQDLSRRLPQLYDLPAERRRGVYESTPHAMSKIEIYRHYTKVDEQHLCRGQGDPEP